MASLPFRDQGVNHSIKMSHAPAGREAARWDGVQSVTTPAAIQTLVIGGAGTNEIRIQSNILVITPDSDMRTVKLPTVAAMKGLALKIVNGSSDHAIDLRTSTNLPMISLEPDASTEVSSDGTSYIGAASGAEVGVRRTSKKALTNAEVDGLHTTPITLIPAPGAGKFIQVLSVHCMYKYGAAFTSIDASDELEIRYTGDSGAELVTAIECDGFLTLTADAHRFLPAISTVIVPVANAPVVVHMASSSIGGGAGSHLVFVVDYIVRTLDLT
jgi:hypothetical protein